ncbi:hypothetical protein ABE26_11750 [Cytobacillus firmus]|nr:hypothetical protein [Cytobacillus firmus]
MFFVPEKRWLTINSLMNTHLLVSVVGASIMLRQIGVNADNVGKKVKALKNIQFQDLLEQPH